MAKLMYVTPTSLDVALFGAQPFYTDGIKCFTCDSRGRKSKRIPKPDWYSGPLDALLED